MTPRPWRGSAERRRVQCTVRGAATAEEQCRGVILYPGRSASADIKPVRRRGSSAIEFALCLPFLLTLAAGLVDWGQFFVAELSVVAITRDAARSAIGADDPEDDATGRAQALLAAAGMPTEGATVAASVETDATLGRDVVTVQVTVPRGARLSLVPSPDEVRATATLLLEE